jgi:hypothetical protein
MSNSAYKKEHWTGTDLLKAGFRFVFQYNLQRFASIYTNWLTNSTEDSLCLEIIIAKVVASFMESDGSLSYSEEPATGTYPEPDESIPHPHISFL